MRRRFSPEVIIVSEAPAYGVHPSSVESPPLVKQLVEEYNRTSGKTPYKFKDFRAWKKQKVLMLQYKPGGDNKELLHTIRMYSLNNKQIVFIFVGNQEISYLSTLCNDSSDDTNYYITYPRFRDSNMFRDVGIIRKFLGLKPINWSPL